ncbi:MAG: hypothetical protein ACIALR_07395, partial [Blastopirellula sp. JB062]
LVVISERMPDESGCLIARKLRLNHCLPVVWLYAFRQNQMTKRFGKFCGIDKVVEYDGVLRNLGEAIQGRLQRSFKEHAQTEVSLERRPFAI